MIKLQRHQATCIRKIAEFDQYFYGEDVKDVKRRAKTKNQCRAIAKRFKDRLVSEKNRSKLLSFRCNRIESCCIRVKT